MSAEAEGMMNLVVGIERLGGWGVAAWMFWRMTDKFEALLKTLIDTTAANHAEVILRLEQKEAA